MFGEKESAFDRTSGNFPNLADALNPLARRWMTVLEIGTYEGFDPRGGTRVQSAISVLVKADAERPTDGFPGNITGQFDEIDRAYHTNIRKH